LQNYGTFSVIRISTIFNYSYILIKKMLFASDLSTNYKIDGSANHRSQRLVFSANLNLRGYF